MCFSIAISRSFFFRSLCISFVVCCVASFLSFFLCFFLICYFCMSLCISCVMHLLLHFAIFLFVSFVLCVLSLFHQPQLTHNIARLVIGMANHHWGNGLSYRHWAYMNNVWVEMHNTPRSVTLHVSWRHDKINWNIQIIFLNYPITSLHSYKTPIHPMYDSSSFLCHRWYSGCNPKSPNMPLSQ